MGGGGGGRGGQCCGRGFTWTALPVGTPLSHSCWDGTEVVPFPLSQRKGDSSLSVFHLWVFGEMRLFCLPKAFRAQTFQISETAF